MASATDDLLERHARLRSAPDESRSARPTLRAAILTCMDARIDTYRLFGLRPGEAHVLRNAGGVVTDDVVRSLAISQRKLGTAEVLLVHHSCCGMATFTDDDFAAELAADCGAAPSWSAQCFRDPAEHVRDDVARLRDCPYLRPGTPVRGFVLDVEYLTLHEVAGGLVLADDRRVSV